ncbi:MAG: alcohol dehydrogenase catalytic domain-containing protein [Chloroflexi bacterium]|nr:alcohol dehydrogenase catalytic domain-containing protein [Chloroflexota bacterium]
MQALWLENQTLSFRDDVPIPTPPEGEALIRVRLAGICSTDLELVRGYYPYAGIPGHEFVGDVVAASDANWRGVRVVGEINASCGECQTCRAGHPTHCERRTALGIINRNGAFAEYLILPVKNLHRVPASIPYEIAVFTEPLAAALEIQEQVQIVPTDRVLVIGAGRQGQLIALTLALTGCDLQVVARHEYQRAALSACHIAAISEDAIPIRKMDVVVDAAGSPGGFELARKAIRPRGTIVLKSTYAGDLRVNFSSIVVDEITLVGSRCGPFEPALRLLESGLVDPRPLITARYPLSDGVSAFECAAKPGCFKVLLEGRGQRIEGRG